MKLPFRYDRSLCTIEDEGGRVTLFGLLMPIFWQLIFTQLLSTISTVILNRVSEQAVTATSIAGQVLNVGTTLCNIVATGLSILLGHALGAGNLKKAKDTVTTSFFLLIPSSVLISALFLLFADPLNTFMGLKGNTLLLADSYLKARSWWMAAICLNASVTALLKVNGFGSVCLISGLVSSISSVGLSYLAVALSATESEAVTRVGTAGGIATVIGLLYSLLVLYRKRHAVPLTGSFSRRIALDIFKVGLPGCLSILFYNICSTVSSKIVLSLGEAMVNARVYYTTISNYAIYFTYALGQSNAILIGRYYGGGHHQKADRLFRQYIGLAPLINGVLSFGVFLFRRPLSAIFSADPGIVAVMGWLFLLDIPLEMARGINHISENALVFIKDTTFTSVVAMAVCFSCNVALCAFLCLYTPLGLYGYVISGFISEFVKGFLFLIRWKRLSQKRMQAPSLAG